MKINMNQRFAVVLTEEGAAIHNKAHPTLRPRKAGDKEVDVLWGLFATYGPYVSMVLGTPFKDNDLTAEDS